MTQAATNRGPTEVDSPVSTTAIAKLLMEGETAVAQRRDLGELHKRLVTAMGAMTEKIGEAQSKHYQRHEKETNRRLDDLSHAVNGLEAALRIELEPMISRSVAESGANTPVKKPRRLIWIVLAFVCGFGAAAFFDEPLRPWIDWAEAEAIQGFENIRNLYPNGGITELENTVD